MTETLQRDDRGETGAFAPIERRRLVERLGASASCPVALLIAPAGYGKSVALRQYLARLQDAGVCFTVRAEHANLLGFLRGLAEVLRGNAPHAITALAGAYERNTASPKRGPDLARWMHAHLEAFAGVIAIDDLHVADGDPEVARFLTALIERTKGRIRWIIASRSTTGLPVGTWFAYRDAELPVNEQDLRFTLDEAREASSKLGLSIRDEELTDLLTLTDGWPAAMSFALRTSTHSAELRNISALTREMIYRLLAEQVYVGLNEEEQALLEVAVALPAIDIGVLERGGFDRALTIVERLRERTAFIHEETPGAYQCHELFREFVRHQTALGGKLSQQAVHERAARALEAGGDVEHAIASYVSAGSRADVVRLLEEHGFDLLERARGDVVGRALESLDEKTRRENPAVLALQGSLHAIAGKFARAESFLRRSLARAHGDRDLIAIASLRLASLIGNQGRDVIAVLEPVAKDLGQAASYRAEALSLIAARQAISGDLSTASTAVQQIEKLLPRVDADAPRARVLHHVGIVNKHVGDVRKAFKNLEQASQLATEMHFFSVAGRAFAVLSNLALHERDDVDEQLRYAISAADAATKAGDAYGLQTALLQMLSARMRRGSATESLRIEQQLASLQIDSLASCYVMQFRAVRLAWEGEFSAAHSLLSTCWNEMLPGVDRASSGAHYALFLALSGERDRSIEQVRSVLNLLESLKVSGRFDTRSATICFVLCAIAEVANGRTTKAERILQRTFIIDAIENASVKAGHSILRSVRTRSLSAWRETASLIEGLARAGYGDVGRLLAAASAVLRRRSDAGSALAELSNSEREILRRLSEGVLPRDIATESRRSVHTVRAHIANAIAKLGCHGRDEAIEAARQRGLV